MDSVRGFSTDQAQLAGVVSGVRNRWRLKRALRGATITVAVGFVVLGALGVRHARAALRRRRDSGCSGSLSLAAIIACACGSSLVPSAPRRGAAQVALYIEEHERSLDGAVVTAVDAARLRCDRRRGAGAFPGARRAARAVRARSHAPRGRTAAPSMQAISSARRSSSRR